jgi:hypothetical protein
VDQVELLTAIIEVSIALIGFSGLVVILGRRSSGEWVTGDRLRLIVLLGLGFISFACALVALTFVSSGLSHSAAWAFSSLVWLIFSVPFLVFIVSKVFSPEAGSELDREPFRRWAWYFGVGLGVFVTTAGLQVANAAFLLAFWPFFLGLVVLLILGVVQFFRLLWFGLFPHQGAAPQSNRGRVSKATDE